MAPEPKPQVQVEPKAAPVPRAEPEAKPEPKPAPAKKPEAPSVKGISYMLCSQAVCHAFQVTGPSCVCLFLRLLFSYFVLSLEHSSMVPSLCMPPL